MNNILELASSLKQSPLFQLSQNKKGSIEGLQSNFLARIAEEYPEAVALWLREVLEVFTETVVRVQRNVHSFDLLLFLDFEDKGPVVVVKHNMASISNPDELQHIVDTARIHYGDRAKFLLFSLNNPAPFLPLFHPWSVCRYDYYAETLQTVRTRRYGNTANGNSDYYHAALLSDYVFTLRQYSHLYDLVANIGNEEPFLGSLRELCSLRERELERCLVNIRCEALLNNICKRLTIPLHTARSSRKTTVGSMYGYCGATNLNNTPRVGFECVILLYQGEVPINLGVQVEGNQFRLYASMQRGGNELEKFVVTLQKEKHWFTFQETPELQALERLWGEKNYEGTQTKDFYGYSQNGIKNFIYCYKTFADAVSADELINAVVAYIQYVRKFFVT